MKPPVIESFNVCDIKIIHILNGSVKDLFSGRDNKISGTKKEAAEWQPLFIFEITFAIRQIF